MNAMIQYGLPVVLALGLITLLTNVGAGDQGYAKRGGGCDDSAAAASRDDAGGRHRAGDRSYGPRCGCNLKTMHLQPGRKGPGSGSSPAENLVARKRVVAHVRQRFLEQHNLAPLQTKAFACIPYQAIQAAEALRDELATSSSDAAACSSSPGSRDPEDDSVLDVSPWPTTWSPRCTDSDGDAILYVACGAGAAEACDSRCGHGSHVAGIAAGNGAEISVTPGASIIPSKAANWCCPSSNWPTRTRVCPSKRPRRRLSAFGPASGPSAAAGCLMDSSVVEPTIELRGNIVLLSVDGEGSGGDAAIPLINASLGVGDAGHCEPTDAHGDFSCIVPTGWSGSIVRAEPSSRFQPAAFSTAT